MRPVSAALLLPAVVLSTLVACKAETPDPDLSYSVTVTSMVEDDSLVTDCISEGEVFDKTFTYELYFDESNVELKIDGEGFATGTRSGCELAYQSAIWLEERPDGNVRWQLTGDSTYEGASGGCDLAEGVDWEGVEVIEVVESEDESVPEGCTYKFETVGSLVAG